MVTVSNALHHKWRRETLLFPVKKEDDTLTQLNSYPIAGPASVYSAGMQYAIFILCIDFRAQIGDWITVPIVAALGITRENH